MTLVLLSLASSVLIFFASPASAFLSDSGFMDVPDRHPYVKAIAGLHFSNMIDGDTNVSGQQLSTFRPDDYINRAEFTKIVMALYISAHDNAFSGYNWYLNNTPKQCFSDVNIDQWFGMHVCEAKDRGFVSGYEDGSFLPANSITFAEVAKIVALANALEVESGSVWYEGYVKALEEEKAIPVSVRRFDQQITRGEMADIIWQLNTRNHDHPTQTFSNLKLHSAEPTEVQTYVSADHSFLFEMPMSWDALHPEKVGDGLFFQANSPDGFLLRHMKLVDSQDWVRQASSRPIRDAWSAGSLPGPQEGFGLLGAQMQGAWKRYEFIYNEHDGIVLTYYVLFSNEEQAVVFAFQQRDAVSMRIRDSFR